MLIPIRLKVYLLSFALLVAIFGIVALTSCDEEETTETTETTNEENITYKPFTVTKDNRALVGFTGAEGEELVIPETFQDESGDWYEVVAIDSYSFNNSPNLESVVIPDSVETIGEGAFFDCPALRSLHIGKLVRSIGGYDAGSVYNGIGLAFRYCSSLESLTVTEGNASYCALDNCLIETDTKTLILGCKTSVIPSDGSVTKIGRYAFSHCEGLTEIEIPSTVTGIGSGAFSWCMSLERVVIPDSVVRIDSLAFELCESLESVVLPPRVKRVSDGLFSHCTNLKSVTLSEGTTSIGDRAFETCTSLSSITIPETVTSIGEYAFSACPLTSVTLPKGLSKIEPWTFYFCTSLSSINIPEGVTSIGEYAFSSCKKLKSVTFENTNGWKIGRDAVDVTKSSDVVKRLSDTDRGYTWTRE